MAISQDLPFVISSVSSKLGLSIRTTSVSKKHQINLKKRRCVVVNRESRRILTKTRSQLRKKVQRRRPVKGVERRIKTLKKLIPTTESMDVDELFEQTANHIMSLQRRIEVMKVMVKAFEDSNE